MTEQEQLIRDLRANAEAAHRADRPVSLAASVVIRLCDELEAATARVARLLPAPLLGFGEVER